MCQYASVNGSATDWHLQHLGSFSLGAAGLVMTEMTNVNPVGRITHKCAGLWSDENEAALKRVIDFCKTYGVAKLGIQLAHAGRKGSTQPPAAGGKPLKPEENAWETVAPSALPYDQDWPAAAGDDHGRDQADGRRLRRLGAARAAHRLRPDRAAWRPRLSAAPVPLAACPTSAPTSTAAASRTACAS